MQQWDDSGAPFGRQGAGWRAPAAPTHDGRMDAHQELPQLESDGWEALAGRRGPAGAREFYGVVLDDAVTMLLPGGLVITERASALDAMSGPPWREYRLTDLRVALPRPDVGLVTYAVVARREEEYSALVSSLYVRRVAGWRLAFHQQTPR